MVSGTVCIADRPVSPGYPVFIIAEAGVNHNGDTDLAHRLVDAAADAGADAVKFQTFRADRLVQRGAPQAAYQRRNAPDEDQWRMLKCYELDREAHVELKRHAEERGLVFLSSPFDEEAADLLRDLEVAAYKIPSGELTNHPLLAHVAAAGRPMLVSTGMADLDEVLAAHAVLEDAGCPHLFLHCTSDYPAAPEHLNLRAIPTIADATGVSCGYSDHSEGQTAAVAAVALGACILEKHLTLDRSLPGPDHRASLEPDVMRRYVQAVREAQTMLGDGRKTPTEPERDTARLVRKSLAYARDAAVGTVLAPDHLVALRPGTGIPPSRIQEVVGRRLRRNARAGALVSEEDL